MGYYRHARSFGKSRRESVRYALARRFPAFIAQR